MNKAIFLDRDGIINKEKGYLTEIKEIEIIGGFLEVFEKLKEKGFLLIVISNQPAIGEGLVSKKKVEIINREINSKIRNIIDKFYFCPHHPNAKIEEYRIACGCRKPSIGMLLIAKKNFNIDLKKSWMVGDRISDIVAGKKAGCKTILLENENSYKKIKGINYEISTKPNYKIKKIIELKDIIN
jgi:D-glycero-D-manno-heptose 1,7-bisphosphate phosphatase